VCVRGHHGARGTKRSRALSALPADHELHARSKEFPETGDEQACPIIHALWLTLHVKTVPFIALMLLAGLRTIAGEI
jgi:hypothetical protein